MLSHKLTLGHRMSRPIACRGAKFTIAFAVEKSGRVPGLEFFESLPVLEQAKLMRLFELVADLGRSRNPEKFGDLGEGLFEFKSHLVRMPFVYHKRQRALIVVTHGFFKKKRRTPHTEIERARRILAEDDNRPGPRILPGSRQ